MNDNGRTAFADAELSELFEGEPELLAIADAVIATTTISVNAKLREAPRPPLFQRIFRRRTQSVAATALVLAVIVAAPAVAFSSTVRELVGLKSSSRLVLQATLTGVFVHPKPYPFANATVTVTFTIGEPGKPPGSGIPQGSVIFMIVSGKAGHPPAPRMVTADGAGGRYSATSILPPGGIGGVSIGGWLNTSRPYATSGGPWIPVTNPNLIHP